VTAKGIMMSDPANDRSGDRLGPNEQARLAHILARLESPFENERAIAGRLATEFITRFGLHWSDLAAFAPRTDFYASEVQPPPRKRQRRRPGSGYWAGYCRRRAVASPGKLDILA
jgi:hypothetical protein